MVTQLRVGEEAAAASGDVWRRDGGWTLISDWSSVRELPAFVRARCAEVGGGWAKIKLSIYQSVLIQILSCSRTQSGDGRLQTQGAVMGFSCLGCQALSMLKRAQWFSETCSSWGVSCVWWKCQAVFSQDYVSHPAWGRPGVSPVEDFWRKDRLCLFLFTAPLTSETGFFPWSLPPSGCSDFPAAQTSLWQTFKPLDNLGASHCNSASSLPVSALLCSGIDFSLSRDQSAPCPHLCNPFFCAVLTDQGQKPKKKKRKKKRLSVSLFVCYRFQKQTDRKAVKSLIHAALIS